MRDGLRVVCSHNTYGAVWPTHARTQGVSGRSFANLLVEQFQVRIPPSESADVTREALKGTASEDMAEI